MKSVAISFSLRDQKLSAIFKQIKNIAKRFDDDDILLIHGNLPRHEVKIRRKSTELVDNLYNIFPIQLNLWKEGTGTLRPEMGYFAKALNATVYVIGRIDGHVAKEIEFYKMYNIEINYIKLE